MDAVGPLPPGRHGERYWLTIVDDATGFTAATPMVARSEALMAVKRYLKRWETIEKRCRRIRLDKAGEFTSNEMLAFLQDKGIAAEFTATDQHQSNGMAEVTNRILEERLHAVLIDSGLNVKFWPDLIGSVAYLRTLTPHIRLNMTPYQAWFGTVPDVAHLRLLGSWCLSYKTGLRNKIGENKGVPCRLLGYEGASVYRILREDGVVTTTHDLVCLEDRPCAANFWAGQKRKREDPPQQLWKRFQAPQRGESNGRDPFFELPEINTDSQEEPTAPPSGPALEAGGVPTTTPNGPALGAGGVTVPPRNPPNLESTTPEEPQDSADSTPLSTPPSSDSGEPDHIVPTNTLERHPELQLPGPAETRSGRQYGIALAAVEDSEPQTYKEARQSPHWPSWSAAIDDEIASLEANKTWALVPKAAQHALGGKWVFKIKRGPQGEVLRYKARWVVRGFEQQEGIDYHETFASVVKPMSYKALFAIAAAMDLEIHQMDVKTAFLYGDIDTEIFVEPPHGLKGSEGKLCRLRKALYGLKQSPRIWYDTLANFMKEQGFFPTASDPGIFAKGLLFVAIYVDDLLIAGASLDEISALKTALSARFEMSDLGECRFYLGMEIIRDRPNRTLRLSQAGYLAKILEDFGMAKCSSNSTPMGGHLGPGPEGFQALKPDVKRYQKAVGSLMYLMLGTRPDIAFAVGCLSRYMANPAENHHAAVKHLWRYLKGTDKLVLVYKGKLQALQGYTDADWGSDLEKRRSTSGYTFNLGSAAISWSLKR